MSPELDKKLVESFPNLYKDRYADMRTTCLCWGFEHGDGWFQILWDVSEKLEKEIIKIKKHGLVWHRRLKRYLKNYKHWLINYKFKCSKIIREIYKDQPIPTWKKYQEMNKPYWPCASQVKEKFGTLCLYMTCYSDEMDKYIEEAERKSAITCEACGKPGKRNKYGWLQTLCDECRGFNLEEREKEFEEKEGIEPDTENNEEVLDEN